MSALDKKKIKLFNRYGDDTYLEQVEGDTYLLHADSTYIRVIYEEDKPGKIFAVDPPGGPFLNVGDHVEDMVIKEIIHKKEEGFILKLG